MLFAHDAVRSLLRREHDERQAEASTLRIATSHPTVIPAKAGIHASCWRWIPAFAGMTMRNIYASVGIDRQHAVEGVCSQRDVTHASAELTP